MPMPGEQAPQAAKRLQPPVTKTAPSRRLLPGDLICGQCGEGNPPVRKFCSRCGTSLVEAEVVKRPWWKKLLPSRGPKVVAIGTQPGHAGGGRFDIKLGVRKAYRRARAGLAILVVIAGLAYAISPQLKSTVNGWFSTAKSRVITLAHPTYVPVHPVRVVANEQLAGHPGQLATDEFTNTYWLAPWKPVKEPTLTLTFAHKVTLKEMILYSGVAAHYVAFGRPAVLHLVFSNGNSDTITPQDTDKPQTLRITGASGITSVEFQVIAVYQGNGAANMAITEIELFSLHL